MYQLNTNLSSKVLHISTSQLPATSFVGGNKSHLRVQLKNPIICNPKTEHILVSLHSLSAPMSFYNITSKETTFRLTEGSTTNTITVAQGNYTIRTLLAAIKARMNAVSVSGTNAYDLTYDNLTNQVVLTASNAAISKTINFNVDNSLHKALGFAKSSYAFTTTLRSVNAINLYDKLSLYIRTSLSVAGALDGQGNLTDILERVPIKSAGSILFFEPPASIFKQLLDRNIVDTFELKITYDDPNELVNFNELDYEISLRFDIVKGLERGDLIDIREQIDTENY